MMLDKKTIEKILALPDDKLLLVIKGLAQNSGVDISNMNIGKEQLAGIRSALSVATVEDIARAAELIKTYQGKR